MWDYLVIEIKYSQKAETLNSRHERSQSSKYIFCNETTLKDKHFLFFCTLSTSQFHQFYHFSRGA